MSDGPNAVNKLSAALFSSNYFNFWYLSIWEEEGVGGQMFVRHAGTAAASRSSETQR